MKICVSFRDSIANDLHADNLRGESRWERQAFEAILENPEVTDVYSTEFAWNRSHPKYRGKLNRSNANNTILLTHDYNKSVFKRFQYKAIIANLFSGPWENQKIEIRNFVKEYSGKLLFTVGYQSLYKDNAYAYLSNFIDSNNIHWLPVPGASNVIEGSHFNKKILLWPYRVLFIEGLYNAPSIIWALQQLQKDIDLKLKIICGWTSKESKDYVDETVVFVPDQTTYFWNRPEIIPYLDIKDRVYLYYTMPYNQVLKLYSNTKLVLPLASYYGGPPIEAAMHGIPFVGSSNIHGALCECKNYIFANSPEEQLTIFNKLISDEEYYNLIGNSYRQFVKNTYTYNAFNNVFNKIVKDNNLI